MPWGKAEPVFPVIALIFIHAIHMLFTCNYSLEMYLFSLIINLVEVTVIFLSFLTYLNHNLRLQLSWKESLRSKLFPLQIAYHI